MLSIQKLVKLMHNESRDHAFRKTQSWTLDICFWTLHIYTKRSGLGFPERLVYFVKISEIFQIVVNIGAHPWMILP